MTLIQIAQGQSIEPLDLVVDLVAGAPMLGDGSAVFRSSLSAV